MSPEEILLGLGDFRIDEGGRVWRVRSWGVVCEPRRAENPTPLGYLQVRRMIDGRRHHVGAHRLVWASLHGPIPAGMVVNHRNGLKDDNRPENLDLSDPSANKRHAYRGGLIDQFGEKNHAHKLTDRQVAQIRLAYALGGYTQADLAGRFGVCHQTISNIVRGERRPKQGGPIDSQDHRRREVEVDLHTGTSAVNEMAAGVR